MPDAPAAPHATPDGRWVLRVLGPGAGFLAGYDPEHAGGLGRVDLTDDLWRAARFPDPQAAVECVRTRPAARPTRPDGRPNRPLTAYHLELLTIDLAREED